MICLYSDSSSYT